jgi:hypothetical protein
MLDLGLPRSDLAQLSDAELIDRFNSALDAYEDVKRRYSFLGFFFLHSGSWQPRALVKDPHEYQRPIHIQCEIRDIRDEMERRAAARRPRQTASE